MTLLQTIKSSIYSPEFYSTLPEKGLKYSFKYFFTLILTLSFIGTILFSIEIIPKMVDFLDRFSGAASEIFPEDLVITFQENGTVSINQEEPYLIPFPEEFRKDIEFEGVKLENLVVIDTKTPFSHKLPEQYKSFLVMGREEIVAWNGSDQSRVLSLNDIDKVVVVDRAFVSTIAAKFNSFLRWIPVFFVFIMFGFFMAGGSMKLAYLFIGALLVMALARIKKRPIVFKEAYQIGLHAATPAILFGAVWFAFIPVAEQVLFAFTIIFLVTVWVNIFSSKDEKMTNKPKNG